MDAKASIAKGLVLALPDDAYGESNTLNGETKLRQGFGIPGELHAEHHVSGGPRTGNAINR